MLQIEIPKYYKVKKEQTIEEIAKAFGVSAYLLVKENGLRQQPYAGQMLKIPLERGNSYVVKAGEDKKLLCGSEQRYERINGTDILYIGMRVIL